MAAANRHSPIYPAAAPAKFSKKRWLWLLLGLSGVAVLSASAGALLAVAIAGTPLMQNKLNAEESKAFNQDGISSGLNFRLPQLTRPVNILVLGVKVLSTDINNPPPETRKLHYQATINSLDGLTDSMLLLRFNPGSQQLVVLSIPRDTRTYVDGEGLTKINEANVMGGPASAARSTSELLGGVGIDRYIRINVLGVEKLIDALGGITVYVPEDMKYQDDSQHLYINLKKGEQHLDGAKAVQFLRFRYDAYGDIGRVQRQQMFFRAMKEQVLKPATLAHLPQILSVVQANLDTNLSVEELIALAGFASQINRSNMQMLMVPGRFSGQEFTASYWLPNQSQIATMVQHYFGLTETSFPTTDTPKHVRIAIQDSTAQTGTVEKLINQLGGAGYGDVFVDQPWNEPLATTRIIAQQGDADKARAIQKSLGFGEVLVESTGSLESDVTIRLGHDALTAIQPSRAPASPQPDTPERKASASTVPAPASSLPTSPIISPAASPATASPDTPAQPSPLSQEPSPQSTGAASPEAEPSPQPAPVGSP